MRKMQKNLKNYLLDIVEGILFNKRGGEIAFILFLIIGIYDYLTITGGISEIVFKAVEVVLLAFTIIHSLIHSNFQ
jgi:hypothetical protein